MSLSVSVVTAHTTTGAYHVKQHPQYTITKATAATLNTNKVIWDLERKSWLQTRQ